MANDKKPNRRHLRHLIQNTQHLGPIEHEEIFKILSKHNVDYTRNSNGIFVNLSRVSDDVITEVKNFVEFCSCNKHRLDEYDKRLMECKLSHDFDRFMHVVPSASAAVPIESDVSEPDPPPVSGTSMMVITVAKKNVKFNQAKKKYAKRVVSDKKTTDDGWVHGSVHELTPEPYDASFLPAVRPNLEQ